MPKNTKDTTKNIEKETTLEKKAPKSVSTKKSTTKKTTSKTKTVSPKKQVASKTKTTKTNSKATTKKKTTTKTSSATTKKKTTSKLTKKVEIIEYYDLPYRYNKTVVKLLAQTPNTLFVYWDISDEDRENFTRQYGTSFFDRTKPVLIVKNKTKQYQFEIDINDFANSWYLQVKDAKCDYEIELGRRSNDVTFSLPNHYVSIITSNPLETPNDRILIEQLHNPVLFRNIKQNTNYTKNVELSTILQENGTIFSVKDFYTHMYHGEFTSENRFHLDNPSSGNPTSTFK